MWDCISYSNTGIIIYESIHYKTMSTEQKATHGARKHAWCTQAAWAKKKEEEKKVGENNGQLCFRPPPRVAQASRLDQLWGLQIYSRD